MDRAGRRPILLSGAAAMAVFLTLTGYWIYIDQAYTPNAGESYDPGSRKLAHAGSRDMCDHLQRGLRHVMGTCPLAVSARDHAIAFPGKGCLAFYRYELALCAFFIPGPAV